METRINPFQGKTIKEILAMCAAVVTHDHFVYKGKDHGSAYINKDALYSHPEALFETSYLMAQDIFDSFDCSDLHCVVGPATAGAILTEFIGFHLTNLSGREIITAYADKDGDNFVIKRGYDKEVSGLVVLGVDDVVNTGGSLKGVLGEIIKNEGILLGAASICNRGGITAADLDLDPGKFRSLMNAKLERFPANECPLCAAKIKINDELGHGKQFIAEHPEAASWTNKTTPVKEITNVSAEISLPEKEKEVIPAYSVLDG